MNIWRTGLVVFFATFLIYGFSVSDWRFWWDDYAYTEKIEKCDDVVKFFTTYPHNVAWLPPNQCEKQELTFGGVMYRPLASLWLAVEMTVIGNQSPYIVYWITTALYAACVTMFFYLLTFLMTMSLAVMGSLLFAFHPCMGNWMGQFCVQPIHLATVLFGVIILLARHAYVTKTSTATWIATFIFAVIALTHEWFLIIPVWLWGGVFSYAFFHKSSVYSAARKAFYFTYPFFIVLLLYFVARVMTYPMASVGGGLIFVPAKIWTLLRGKLFDFQFASMALDLFGLCWLPHGYRLTKCLFLLALISGYFFLLLTSSKKWQAFFLGFSSLAFYWMSFLIPHCDRYAYLSIAFLIASFLVSVSGKNLVKYFVCGICFILGIIGLLNNRALLQIRSKRRIAADNSLKKFVKNETVNNTPILFVGIPFDWFPLGLVQGLFLHRGSDKIPAYYDLMLTVFCHDCVQRKKMWDIPCEDLVDVEWNGSNKLRITSKNKDRAWFYARPEEVCSVGKRTVLDSSAEKLGTRAYDVCFEIDKKWLYNGLKLIGWDFVGRRFVQLS